MTQEQKGLRKQSILAIFTRIGAIGIGLFLSLFLGRSLGAAGSGQFFKVFALISFLSILAKVGLDRTMMRFSSTYWANQQWGELKGLKRYATKIVSIWSGVGFLLMFIFASEISIYLLNDISLVKLVRIGGVALLTLSLVQNGAEALKGIERVQLGLFYSSGLVQLLFLVISAMGLWWFWKDSNHSIEIVMASYSFAVLISGLVVFTSWYRKTNDKIKFATPNYSHKNEWKKSARAIFWSSIFHQANNSIPVFALSFVGTESDIGLFEMGKRAAQLTAFFLVATNSVLGPRISTLYSKGELHIIRQICQKITGLVLLLSTPVFLVYFIFPDSLMSLFGKDFTDGSTILIILTIGQLVNVVMGPAQIVLMMTGREGYMRNILIGSFGVLVVGLYIGLHFFGTIGAAFALSGALIFQNFAAAFVVWRELQIITLPFIDKLYVKHSEPSP